MNSKYTVGLLVIFIALALAAYFAGKDREPTNMTEGTATPTPAPMLALEAADVQEFLASGPDGEVTLARVSGGWEVDGEPADDLVDGTIERLSPPDVIRVLTDRNPDDYGFATPTLTITLKTQSGTEHVLLFGDDTPVDGNVYVRVGEEGPIYIVLGTDVATVRGWLTSPPLAPTATATQGTQTAGPAAGTVTPAAADGSETPDEEATSAEPTGTGTAEETEAPETELPATKSATQTRTPTTTP
jgi:hypothetical protein